MRDGAHCVLSDIPYVSVSKYFVKDIGKEFVQQSMQRRLKDCEHERAVEILERGLWVEPPGPSGTLSARASSKNVS
eukprot:9501453-Pyramimonas_sp.AAC.1